LPRCVLIGLLAAFVLAIASGTAYAGSIESLVMPGKVIEGHAKIETECNKCHARFSKQKQDTLCRSCHEKVDADIRAKTGFHGRAPSVRRQPCKNCHTDHEGRDANVVILDKQTFDHRYTDYPLRGRHTQASCDSCHKPGKKYRDAPSACYSCHKDDDAHKGRLGKKCGQCHSEQAWGRFRFDHDKTRFPLRGKHRKVDCASCHPNEHYKRTPTACVACHQLDDKHRGRFGKKCESCHTATGWKAIKFDHARDTKFPLRGAHADIRCEDCHRGMLYEETLGTDCYSCHKFDDRHKGRFGRQCDTCHRETQWKMITFDHDRDTKYPLRGKHTKVACESCHKGNLYKDKLKTNCNACHAGDDVHKGQQGTRCEQCHNEDGWNAKVAFDHGLTKFPLIGLHAVTPCEECHVSSAFKDTSTKCNACHAKDDAHHKTLGTDCQTCHNPNGWRFWSFDHDTQTDFKLDGAHAELTCKDCHDTPVEGKIQMSTACIGCHANDDIHRGQFGQRCERCHVTTRFRDIKSQFTQ